MEIFNEGGQMFDALWDFSSEQLGNIKRAFLTREKITLEEYLNKHKKKLVVVG